MYYIQVIEGSYIGFNFFGCWSLMHQKQPFPLGTLFLRLYKNSRGIFKFLWSNFWDLVFLSMVIYNWIFKKNSLCCVRKIYCIFFLSNKTGFS